VSLERLFQRTFIAVEKDIMGFASFADLAAWREAFERNQAKPTRIAL